MNEQSTYLVRAIKIPVILIAVGVLFAFDRFTEFRISRTWPVLLIVIGLLQLARWQAAPLQSASNSPIAIRTASAL